MSAFGRRLDRARARLAYAAQERLMGRHTFALLRELAACDTWPLTKIAELQCRRLNDLMHVALAHSPWHAARIRAAGLEARVLRKTLELDDLAALPTMDRHDARTHVASLVWRGVPGGAQRYSTGGSSGEPLIFFFGRARQAADAACRLRARGWWGVQPGDREAYLWGAPVELGRLDHLKTARDRLVNHRILNAFQLTPRRMDEYLATLSAWRPACLYGYSSSLAMLARHALARGARARWPELRVVCTTGEPLYPDQRSVIAEAFGTPVANEYGCRDGGLVAHEAPGGLLRVMQECILVELLDPEGRPVPEGGTGEIVLTNLASAAQPFIRYRTGDMGRAAPGRDGRFVAALGEVTGRQTDFITAPDGTVMHALAVIYEFRGVEGIEAFKFIQCTPEDFEIKLVPGPTWSSAAQSRLEVGLRRRLGDAARLRFEFLDAIPPEASGKHRYVVSRVPTEPRPMTAGGTA